MKLTNFDKGISEQDLTHSTIDKEYVPYFQDDHEYLCHTKAMIKTYQRQRILVLKLLFIY